MHAQQLAFWIHVFEYTFSRFLFLQFFWFLENGKMCIVEHVAASHVYRQGFRVWAPCTYPEGFTERFFEVIQGKLNGGGSNLALIEA